MTLRRCAAVLLLAFAAPLPAGTELAPEILLLAHIKAAARQGLSQIPAYACEETVERFTRSSTRSRFKRIDSFQVQVAQIGTRELFARPGDKEFQDKPLAEMVRPGMVATGIFSLMADTVFLNSATAFQYGALEQRLGRKAVRYGFRVSHLFSAYQIVSNNYRAVVAMEGSFWADPDNYDVLELEVRGAEIPPELKLLATTTLITYNSPKIDERHYLIPSSATITLISATGSENENRTEFRGCRKYTGESKITF